jgi:glycerol-3-phosphate acyltransferase PlsY
MIQLIGPMVIGYLFGAIPFGFLVLKQISRKDIRREGTGNVGAMNAYEVSEKKYIGILVGLLDILKGVAAVLLAVFLWHGSFIQAGIAAFFVVIGHNYNIFLRLRGGRGLAPAAGVMAVINPFPVFLFGLMWLTGYYVIRRNVHVANVTGVIGASLLMFNVPELLLEKTSIIAYEQPLQLKLLVLMICIQILIRHAVPLRSLIKGEVENP